MQDLLADKAPVKMMEDKQSQIQFQGLTEVCAQSTKELLSLMERASSIRTTHSTINNDESSRSHAICQIYIKDNEGNRKGRLILVDLAVSLLS